LREELNSVGHDAGCWRRHEAFVTVAVSLKVAVAELMGSYSAQSRIDEINIG